MVWNNQNLVEKLKEGGVIVMPTDTLYGIVGSALDVKTVEKIYSARKRNPEKPCIILIANMDELKKFGIILTDAQKREIEKFTSAAAQGSGETRSTSFILDCNEEKFAHLHRGTKTLAFRIPGDKNLQILLKETGPLVAPSANIEGEPPAKNIEEAKKYFGDKVELYIDGGERSGKASQVIRLHMDGRVEILRK